MAPPGTSRWIRHLTARHRRIPLGLKLAYTAFVAVLVPVYAYYYGPANFLYFCDVALLLTLAGLWLGSPLLISMCAVGILAPQMVWLLDYAAHVLGTSITGMTGYMFDTTKPLFLRGLSLFHGWLPLLLIYLVWKTGYDRRAFGAWTALATVIFLVCYFLMPGPRSDPGNAAVNINYVFGMDDTAAQTWMHPLLWLALLMASMPLLLCLPTHVLLVRWLPPPDGSTPN
jgi:hypothetical protein